MNTVKSHPRAQRVPFDFLKPAVLLRLEGLALLTAVLIMYFLYYRFSAWVFAVLLFTPDVSMMAYLSSPERGRIAYNSVHNTLLPLALAVTALLLGSSFALQSALIWFAHIGMDRMLGYGLKVAGNFKDTHLGRI